MRKNQWRLIPFIALFIMCLTTFPAIAGEWKQDQIGKWYQNDDGSYPMSQWMEMDGRWYWFNQSGYLGTGWISDGKNVYYTDENGVWVESQNIVNKMEFRHEEFQKDIPYIIEKLCMVPDKILNSYFQNSTIVFQMGSGTTTDEWEWLIHVGRYYPSKKQIVIMTSFDYDSILHEMGHYVDDLLGYPSNSQEYKNLMTQYEDVFDDYYLSSPQEFFAEAFAITVAEKGKYYNYDKEDYSDLCLYMQKIIDGIK